MAIVEWLN